MNETMAASVYLPEEIFTEILVRLPVKSLVRFRCLCKSWCSLINNSDFARKNLNYLQSIEDVNHISILSIRYSVSTPTAATMENHSHTINSTTTTTFISNDETSNKENTRIVLSIKDVDDPCGVFYPVGSVDGILCLARSDGGIHLWNPSINKHKSLPRSDLTYSRLDVCGIGYDPSVDDYKVLWAHRKHGLQHSPTEVLALKSNSWKTIQDCLPYNKSYSGNSAVFTNGGIHWRASDIYDVDKIVCFDVVTEKFGEVPLPRNGDHKIMSNRLFVVGGNLSVFQKVDNRVHDVWVMQEYGVRESWVKLITIPLYQGWPICFTRNGQVLFDGGSSRIIMFNPRDEISKRIQREENTGFSRMIAYVDTLVSPIVSNVN